jgi:5-methylcytosine-specific restriction protein A
MCRPQHRMTARALRDHALREKKIRQALPLGGGRLICEVPRCGFDFEAVYGELGKHFAHVHHRKQLKSGERVTKPGDLAIVCANCHAMIHRHGECRQIEELIPPRIISSA